MRRAARRGALVTTAATALLAAGPLAAQAPGPPAVIAADTLAPQHRPWLRSRLERVRRERMARFLDVDSAQAEAIDRQLRAFREREVRLRRERAHLIGQIQAALAAEGEAPRPAARDELLRERLELLRLNESERRRALDELRERLARDLTVEQRARLHVFAERFHRQLEEHAHRVRERRGHPPAGRPALPGRR